MTQEDNFKALCNLTTKLLGLPDNALALKSRKQNLQIPRSIVAVIARTEDNIHRNIIAKILNRDRSLMYHYEKTHKGYYATWADYRDTFNKIYSAYKDITASKESFIDDAFLKTHLLKKGVKETLNPQVFIEVKSGQSICIIKTSYFDFSNQLQKVKFAMDGYHYTIKII